MICAIVHPFQKNIFNNNFTVHPIMNFYFPKYTTYRQYLELFLRVWLIRIQKKSSNESLINHDVDKTLFKEMQIIYVANFGCKKQAIIAY